MTTTTTNTTMAEAEEAAASLGTGFDRVGIDVAAIHEGKTLTAAMAVAAAGLLKLKERLGGTERRFRR